MATRVLFVCYGNICRSPMAEAVFRHLVAQEGLDAAFEIDSAGTGDWHVGTPPHESTQAELVSNGVAVGDQRARQVRADDGESFDYIVAMDTSNIENMGDFMHDEWNAHISLMLDYASTTKLTDVPDPYYEGGYDRVYALLDDSCRGLLDFIVEREGISRD